MTKLVPAVLQMCQTINKNIVKLVIKLN